MPRVDAVNQTPEGGVSLVSASIPLQGVQPETLLRLREGDARGFWAREGRWFAHIGLEAAVKSVWEPGQSGDRFATVWERARTLLGTPMAESGPPPRLFGGFSFCDDHEAQGSWTGFPQAYFILPSVELMGGREGGVLTVRRLVEASHDPTALLPSLKAEVSSLGAELASLPSEKGRETGGEVRVRSEIDQKQWTGMVEAALRAIEGEKLSKVVLARALSASPVRTIDPVGVGLELWRQNTDSHVFLFEPTPGHVLVGAAPETIATVEAGSFRATAVAGSVARGSSGQEEEALASELLTSEKARREHSLCVEDMAERLEALARSIEAEPEPHLLRLASIQHLESDITAELLPGETVLSALRALHPTPAVCGFPRDQALTMLREEEATPRGWYAGPVGWLDGSGNGVFVPALRSAAAVNGHWRLFAGAGIVSGSEPEKEWKETLIKFQPVLKALSGAGPDQPLLGQVGEREGKA